MPTSVPPTGGLVLLKTLYDSTHQESHIISEQEIKLSEDDTSTTTSGEPPAIINMQLLGNGVDVAMDAVYIGTTEALYRFPVANCGRFADDCCACVASRDPHCAYDPSANLCVPTNNGGTGNNNGLIQDVAGGDIAVCSAPPGSGETTPTPTKEPETPVAVETVGVSSTVAAKPSPTLQSGE